jgi:hypothetical protein
LGGASVLQNVDIFAYVDMVVQGYTIREKKYILEAVDVDTYSKNIINSSMKKKNAARLHTPASPSNRIPYPVLIIFNI